MWGLPHPRDILEKDGSEPWWFESGHDWNDGCAYPHGIETRFRDARLAPIFGDVDGFVDAAQEFQYRALKYQIETLRWERPISGYVITELNDVQWELNGLMDVHEPSAPIRRSAGQPAAAVAGHREGAADDNRRRRERRGRRPARGRRGDAKRLRRSPGGSRTKRASIRVGAEPTTIKLIGPPADAIAIQNLDLEASDGAGRLLSRNSLEFCVVPRSAGADAVALCDGRRRRIDILAALDWPNRAASPDEADVVLATRLTTPVRERLIAGTKALLIANSPDALVDPERHLPLSDRHNFPKMELKPRQGTPWDGQWMGAFAWRRIDGPWAGAAQRSDARRTLGGPSARSMC